MTNKRIFYLLVVIFLPAIAFSQEGYVDLIWADEFNVDGAPDPSNWGYDTGANGWGNNELQEYTTSGSNVRVENGMLVIEARKSGGSWTSGRVKSQGKRNFTYGKIVFRAKLPPGQGTWPALWMLGEGVSSIGWPACGEIDVMEHVGKNPGIVHSSLHSTSSSGNTVNTGTTTVTDFNSNFHLYEALWTPDKIQFSVDGIAFYTYNPASKTSATWPFNAPFFIIMNIAIGGNFGGPEVDPSLTFARMEVDYVRVYQNFSALTLQGPSIVDKNQANVSYKTNQIQNATYEWTLPQGAQIVSGDGTSSINVKWGEAEGDVKVKVSFGAQVAEKKVSVVVVKSPQGNAYSLFAPDNDLTWNVSDKTNTYKISAPENQLRVDYTVKQVVNVPALTGVLTRPLNLSAHPILHVRAKSANKSKTLLMRMDWIDENEVGTTKSPVFNFSPLIDDGEYYDYRFDYASTNNWQSSNGAVNSARITKLNFYIDFGTFASLGSDSLWVENIWVEQAAALPLIPNRPSHLKGAINNENLVLSWNDNATNETGFEIHASSAKEGVYSMVSTTAVNSLSASVAHTAGMYYKVRSVNANGQSSFSNAFTYSDIVTGMDREDSRILMYPNPAHNQLFIDHSFTSHVSGQIVDALGRSVHHFESAEKTIQLELPFLSPGLYVVHIRARQGTITRKLLIQ
jgi:beta-glucanase (GH16 family)